MPRTQQRQHGVTIIELLVVIVILSILAAIAVPSYRGYVMRTNRTIAKSALQELITRQESYAVDHKGYAANFDRLGIAGSAAAGIAYVTTDGVISRNPGGALYQLALHDNSTGTLSSCASLGGTAGPLAYRLSATPVQAATDTVCSTLCLASTGEKGNSAGDLASCWRR